MTISNLPRRSFYFPYFREFEPTGKRSSVLNDFLSFSDLWDSNPRGWQVAVDINENEHQYEILADLPGLSEKELDITLNKDVLTIRGERSKTVSEKPDGQNVRTERTTGKFERHIRLPDSADPEKIEASLSNGVLHLSIGKKESVQPRRIELKSAA
ncbi:MAG: Hsp20/alpha crystallin family protein [Gammaproteobacteria bacterium]|nr:Hsp20/alpha crystallin family protein [Gammaproteobacteria bacterium]